ncbi:MAG: T9SS type A sorting domain-containing protein [Melioribacteraceae bacterium]|nr:T9SS type A sorting domain-containing protein [Melioribacteraceae bacterium]
MLKRITFSFIAVLLVVSLSFAGKVEQHKAQKVGADQVATNVMPAKNMTKVSANVLGFTEYDYAGNGTVNEQVWPYDIDGDGVLDPVGTYMERFIDNQTRAQVMFLGLEGEFTNLPASDPALTTGWGTIQSIDEGPWAGHAAIAMHQGGAGVWTVYNLADFSTVYFHGVSNVAQNFPTFAYLADGTIPMQFTDGNFYTTTAADPLTITAQGQAVDPAASENPVRRSPNGEYLAVVADDGAEFVYLYTSNDAGATWVQELIGEQEVSPIVNRPGYLPLFVNFGQRNYAIDNNGVAHVGMNGYSIRIDGADTTFAFPALYWNSRDKDWIAVSDEAEETDQDLAPLRQGNGIGNSYPHPSISPDGMVVSVLYQAPEYDGGTLQIYPGDGSASTFECFQTDIKHTYSADGGKTFTTPLTVDSELGRSEKFPSAYDYLTNNGIEYTVRYAFFVDDVPGVSLFGYNSASDGGYWNYSEITFTAETSVADDDVLVNTFSLQQNYPNPFNPSTTIKYSVPQLSDVSVKVYDVLGKEVATLVDAQQAQGVYEVNFNAANLASGMYIYTIQAGSFTSSKKMLLMK